MPDMPERPDMDPAKDGGERGVCAIPYPVLALVPAPACPMTMPESVNDPLTLPLPVALVLPELPPCDNAPTPIPIPIAPPRGAAPVLAAAMANLARGEVGSVGILNGAAVGLNPPSLIPPAEPASPDL